MIVVVSVDGSLAGIDKETGETLWKQTGVTTPSTTSSSSSSTTSSGGGSSSSSSKCHSMKPNSSPLGGGGGTAGGSSTSTPEAASLRLFFQPLVSTTTTTRSAASSATSDTWKTATVPSTDGHVFLTTSSSDETITSTTKELVARAPFVDDRGRFYVGSRHSIAVALDGNTGEILRVLPHPPHSHPHSSCRKVERVPPRPTLTIIDAMSCGLMVKWIISYLHPRCWDRDYRRRSPR